MTYRKPTAAEYFKNAAQFALFAFLWVTASMLCLLIPPLGKKLEDPR